MSIGAITMGSSPASYKGMGYGQGYGNYQNQNSGEAKTIKGDNGQFSMNQSANAAVDNNVDMQAPAEQAGKGSAVDNNGECQTCKNRRYQDESDDSGVSYQAPTKLSNGNVASAVMSHEQEHVVRNQAKAEREGREIVSQSVMLHTSVCPECGKSYVSGGTTRTVTKADNREAALEAQRKSQYGAPVGGASGKGAEEAAAPEKSLAVSVEIQNNGLGGSLDHRA